MFKSFFEDFYSMFLNCHVCTPQWNSFAQPQMHTCHIGDISHSSIQFVSQGNLNHNNIPKFQLNLWHERDSYLYFLESYINDLYNTEDLIKSPILSNQVEFWWDMEYVCIIVLTCILHIHICAFEEYMRQFFKYVKFWKCKSHLLCTKNSTTKIPVLH